MDRKVKMIKKMFLRKWVALALSFGLVMTACATVSGDGGYAIGDIGPAGGLIFYVDTDEQFADWDYLEAAPASTEWTEKDWGTWSGMGDPESDDPYTAVRVGSTEEAVGMGKHNTELIVVALAKQGQFDKAAQICDTLSTGGKNDWFLPSKDELNLMYTNLKAKGLGGFANDWYWSSSEGNGDGYVGAYAQKFDNGLQEWMDLKRYPLRVRAIRAF
jgi:hypothetical protein